MCVLKTEILVDFEIVFGDILVRFDLAIFKPSSDGKSDGQIHP